jgi:hypothetical protein
MDCVNRRRWRIDGLGIQVLARGLIGSSDAQLQRSALIMYPRKPFCDWVRAVDDDDLQHLEIVEDVGRSSFSHFCDLWFACSHFGLFRSVTKMFETIALWVVLVLFAFGMWLIVGAVWGMATDSSARRSRR